MNKLLQILFVSVFVLTSTSFGQIFMDGESTDWDAYPALIEAPDNLDGMFPPEVGAIVSDIVDVKTVKATVIGNVFFTYIEFWGGPAWPNNALEEDHEGTMYYASRGYYHMMLDLDNDATTGWSTDWYEAHYTTLGYLISQGVALDPVGAEVMLEWGGRTRDEWQVTVDSLDYVRSLDYWAADYEEYDGQTDTGSEIEIFEMGIPNADSARIMRWDGSLKIGSSDDEALLNDTLKSYFNGHAWGHSFLEFAMELTPFQKYYMHKDGRKVLQPGDVIGVCALIETPIDDWGVDMTTRGEVTLPDEVPVRPEIITFDGDESDWANVPVLIEAPDNLDGMFPPEVGAIVTDVVDVKEVKAFIEDDNFFWHIKFWGGPAWPNNALEEDHEGTIYYASRGYYHMMLDLDNDATTGWSTDWYEAHYTTLGYLMSQGVDLAPVGAEVMVEWGGRTRDDYQVEVEGQDPVRSLDYWAADYEEYDGQTDTGTEYTIYEYSVIEKSPALVMSHDGLLLSGDSNDESLMDGNPDWVAHAWGYDFIEVGHSLRAIKQYFKNKDGRDVLQAGDEIGVCALIETPVDDWGVDMTTRGTIGVVVGLSNDAVTVVESYSLSNNYPNPFNPSTKIQYSIPTSEFVSIKVYDAIGSEVATLVNMQQSAGVHNVDFNASQLASGIYFYKIVAGNFIDVKKMMLIK